MDKMKHRRLQELDRSDFAIVEGEPDIRGWDVKIGKGDKIGEVEELILDAQQRKVRYMVVDLKDKVVGVKDKKVLVPIGLAQLDDEEDDVIIPNLHVQQLQELPDYDEDLLDETVERRICEVFGRTQVANTSLAAEQTDTDFYNHDYYNDDNLYRNRMHQAQPVQQGRQESEYERGLKLWERRSEGGIIPENDNIMQRDVERERSSRTEMVRNRRTAYEQRKNSNIDADSSGRSKKKDNSIIRRIKDEGLRDA
jgi:sporulation protein YlmC with PRC-barrel domain